MSDDSLNELLVFGYACKIYRDDDKARWIDAGRHLIPWMGQTDLLIDRYDGRGHLFNLDQYDADTLKANGRLELSEEEQQLETLCDEERYLELHNDLAEQQTYEEEEWKRWQEFVAAPSGSNQLYNAVRFAYDDMPPPPPPPPLPQDAPPPPPSDAYDPVEAADAAAQQQQQDEPYVLTPELESCFSGDIVLPATVRQQRLIEKTARFIAQKGVQMEIVLKTKQANNPQFGFLNYDHTLNAYYKKLLSLFREGKHPTTVAQPSAASDGSEDDSDNEHSGGYLHPLLMSKATSATSSGNGDSLAMSRESVHKVFTQGSRESSYGRLAQSLAKHIPAPPPAPAPPAPQQSSAQQILETDGGNPSSTPDSKLAELSNSTEADQDAIRLAAAVASATSVASALSSRLGLLSASSSSDSLTALAATPPQPPQDEPPPPVRLLIDKMAAYVARNGADFELAILQKNDPRFLFMLPTNFWHGYYWQRREHFRALANNGQLPTAPSVNDLSQPSTVTPDGTADEDRDDSSIVAGGDIIPAVDFQLGHSGLRFALKSTTSGTNIAGPFTGPMQQMLAVFDEDFGDLALTEDQQRLLAHQWPSQSGLMLGVPPAPPAPPRPKDPRAAEAAEQSRLQLSLRDKLAQAARDKLSQTLREKRLQAERKRKAAQFVNLLRQAGLTQMSSDQDTNAEEVAAAVSAETGIDQGNLGPLSDSMSDANALVAARLLLQNKKKQRRHDDERGDSSERRRSAERSSRSRRHERDRDWDRDRDRERDRDRDRDRERNRDRDRDRDRERDRHLQSTRSRSRSHSSTTRHRSDADASKSSRHSKHRRRHSSDDQASDEEASNRRSSPQRKRHKRRSRSRSSSGSRKKRPGGSSKKMERDGERRRHRHPSPSATAKADRPGRERQRHHRHRPSDEGSVTHSVRSDNETANVAMEQLSSTNGESAAAFDIDDDAHRWLEEHVTVETTSRAQAQAQSHCQAPSALPLVPEPVVYGPELPPVMLGVAEPEGIFIGGQLSGDHSENQSSELSVPFRQQITTNSYVVEQTIKPASPERIVRMKRMLKESRRNIFKEEGGFFD